MYFFVKQSHYCTYFEEPHAQSANEATVVILYCNGGRRPVEGSKNLILAQLRASCLALLVSHKSKAYNYKRVIFLRLICIFKIFNNLWDNSKYIKT